VFVFDNNWGSDRIWDFEQGLDKIDLTAVAGISSLSSLILTQTGAGTFIEFDGNRIFLTDVANVTENDLLLV
jgi:hypothetical protein